MTTYNVHVYGHQALVRLPVVADSKAPPATDSILVLSQPYLWVQTLAVMVNSPGTPVSTTIDPKQAQTNFIRVEIPDGQTIRFEIDNQASNRQANANSPTLSGKDQIQFGPDWMFSCIDATGT